MKDPTLLRLPSSLPKKRDSKLENRRVFRKQRKNLIPIKKSSSLLDIVYKCRQVDSHRTGTDEHDEEKLVNGFPPPLIF
jgi:hypothetical protein